MSTAWDEWENCLRSGNGHQSLESAQDLIVGGIIRDLVRLRWGSARNSKAQSKRPYRVHISDNSSDSRQPSPSTGYDANVLVRVLANLSAPVVVVIEVRDGLTKI